MKWIQRNAVLPVFALAVALGVASCNKTPDQNASQNQSGQDQGDPANANLAPVSDAGSDSTGGPQGSSGNEPSAQPQQQPAPAQPQASAPQPSSATNSD